MPRPVLFDCISSNQVIETLNKEAKSKEKWFQQNRQVIWEQAVCPIQGRIMAICQDKEELLRKLMDSKDEYFKFCKSSPSPAPPSDDDTVVVHLGNSGCGDDDDECSKDPTIPMRTPPPQQFALLFEGLSKEGGGAKGYLRNRWDSSLPEIRYCYPPTSNSEYAWKLLDSVQSKNSSVRPRMNVFAPALYRSKGVLCPINCAPYHFP